MPDAYGRGPTYGSRNQPFGVNIAHNHDQTDTDLASPQLVCIPRPELNKSGERAVCACVHARSPYEGRARHENGQPDGLVRNCAFSTGKRYSGSRRSISTPLDILKCNRLAVTSPQPQHERRRHTKPPSSRSSMSSMSVSTLSTLSPCQSPSSAVQNAQNGQVISCTSTPRY